MIAHPMLHCMVSQGEPGCWFWYVKYFDLISHRLVDNPKVPNTCKYTGATAIPPPWHCNVISSGCSCHLNRSRRNCVRNVLGINMVANHVWVHCQIFSVTVTPKEKHYLLCVYFLHNCIMTCSQESWPRSCLWILGQTLIASTTLEVSNDGQKKEKIITALTMSPPGCISACKHQNTTVIRSSRALSWELCQQWRLRKHVLKRWWQSGKLLITSTPYKVSFSTSFMEYVFPYRECNN